MRRCWIWPLTAAEMAGPAAAQLGRQQGLKISLFDVSDVSKPVEVAQFVTEDAPTTAWQRRLDVVPRRSADSERSDG